MSLQSSSRWTISKAHRWVCLGCVLQLLGCAGGQRAHRAGSSAAGADSQQSEFPEAGLALLPGHSTSEEPRAITASEVLPEVHGLAMSVAVQCGETTAHAIVVAADNTARAAELMEAYQGYALEQFWEVTPIERSGAKGVRIFDRTESSELYLAGRFICGIVGAADLQACAPVLDEIAARASSATTS